MSASLKFDLGPLKRLEKLFNDPTVNAELRMLPQKRNIAALIGQAIADNFTKEGPGWKPLKAQTIRQSVAKKLKKKLADMTDKDLLAHEAKTRKTGGIPHRQILRRTGLLMKSATTPGAQNNIWKQEGTKLVWGTNLSYAAIHNQGGIISHPGTDKGFGIDGLKIPPHKIPIPQRKFLVLRDEWKVKVDKLVAETFLKVFRQALRRYNG